MRVAGTFSWLTAAGAVAMLALFLTPATDAYVTSFPAEPDINGILTTVGLTVAHWLAGLIPYPGVSSLIDAIINAWTPKPEDDYWENIEDQVHTTCGEFVNKDNIDKVLVYKDDVMDMIKIYERAPVVGDGTYPDKNVQADAITTSIISNRFLVEAAMMPWSMTLYFVDIASVHLMVLKDVSDSYSFPDVAPSLWWKDLSIEIDHYSAYSKQLHAETTQFRKENIECYFDEGGKLDTYVVTDHVTGEQEQCVQDHVEEGVEGSCSVACANFQSQVLRVFDQWYAEYVGVAVQDWQALKIVADNMAANASPYRVPQPKK